MKPSTIEWEVALEEAERMREANADPYAMAKALQYSHERLTELEHIRELVERYVRFGQDEREHKVLLRALDKAREAEAHRSGGGSGEWGLA